jgi:hypothetical protein
LLLILELLSLSTSVLVELLVLPVLLELPVELAVLAATQPSALISLPSVVVVELVGVTPQLSLVVEEAEEPAELVVLALPHLALAGSQDRLVLRELLAFGVELVLTVLSRLSLLTTLRMVAVVAVEVLLLRPLLSVVLPFVLVVVAVLEDAIPQPQRS